MSKDKKVSSPIQVDRKMIQKLLKENSERVKLELIKTSERLLANSNPKSAGQSVYKPLPFHWYPTQFLLCRDAVIDPSRFSGNPTTLEEIPSGLPDTPPKKTSWSQPALGRIEQSCYISPDVPGLESSGGVTRVTTELVAWYPLFNESERRVGVSINPTIFGMAVSGHFNSLSDARYGYYVVIALDVYSVIGEDWNHDLEIPVFKPPIREFQIDWISDTYNMSTEVRAAPHDFIIMSLAMQSVVIRSDLEGPIGAAIVDIEGLTEPPGKSEYINGALTLPSFELYNPDCPLIVKPRPTVVY